MPRGHHLTPEQRAQIRALRAQGQTGEQVARDLGLSAAVVWRHSRGIDVRRKAEPSTNGHRNWRALPPERVAQIKALRADGHTCAHVAQIVGCAPQTVQDHAPGRIGKVPVAPLREAFLRSPLTAADVARELGWWCTVYGRSCADVSRVKRTLGLLRTVSGHGGSSYRTLVDAETVERIADAIGIAAWEVMPDDEEDAA